MTPVTSDRTPDDQAGRSDRADGADRADHADPTTPPGMRARRRRRRGTTITITVAVVALAAAGVGTAGVLLPGGGDSAGESGDTLPPATAGVLRQTLKDTRSADAQLGYGPAQAATGRLPGTLTLLPKSGTEITRGKALYGVDNQPVVLLYGSLPAYRTLENGAKGADVRQLEENLSALGYTGFTPDEEYTDATAKAVERWQGSLGLKKTGTVELGRVVFTPDAIRVAGLEAEPGDQTGPGQKVLSYTGTAKAVTAELDAADQRLATQGTPVDVMLPDGVVVQGAIAEVSSVSKPAEGQKKAETKIKVVVGLKDDKAREAVRAYDQAGVHVVFTADTRKDVLTVPVSALLALAEGGFGVEVVEGPTSKYVPVTTGLFADGRVEISGGDISEGIKVGMPK
ncbi:peptidoglycan-binding protein [Streptomyces xanthophaeus]|uniref:peptidoglycan-binding protein n=1 Tax=Streptomyces xanthophaeus TaxID=67385 RepID=UPI002647881A|nr:peptidoglycan-binding domain-containing protein [Streptomyces xanthophaeus]WKD37118.1 peptidoglycan-binding protein [Streptomyces xanthophaeus]